jgi:hypothetical protein
MQYSFCAQGHCNTANCKGYFCHHKPSLGPHRSTQFFKIRNTRRTNIFLSYFSSRQAFTRLQVGPPYPLGNRLCLACVKNSTNIGEGKLVEKSHVLAELESEGLRGNDCRGQSIQPQPLHSQLCLHTSLILASVQTNC